MICKELNLNGFRDFRKFWQHTILGLQAPSHWEDWTEAGLVAGGCLGPFPTLYNHEVSGYRGILFEMFLAEHGS
jgi:hypothetical protein